MYQSVSFPSRYRNVHNKLISNKLSCIKSDTSDVSSNNLTVSELIHLNYLYIN